MVQHQATPWLPGRLIAVPVAMLLAVGCERAEPTTDNTFVAVSSPYLEAAVQEVLGHDVSLFRLAGPTMCPGHFDIRPSQISDLARCGLLVRFDFQQSLDAKLRRDDDVSRQTLVVCLPGGLCVPDSYLTACRQIAEHFVSTQTISQTEAEQRLAQLEQRMAALRQEVLQQIDADGLRGAPVLASRHQADFCRWLGLRVAAEISNADAASTSDINGSIKAGEAGAVQIIVANEPEGRRSADALADRLHARVVVFGNFPDMGEEHAFDALVRRNAKALLEKP